MKTSTLLLLLGAAAVGWFLWNQNQQNQQNQNNNSLGNQVSSLLGGAQSVENGIANLV